MFFLNRLLFWLKIVVLSPKLHVLSSKIFKTKSLKKEEANKDWFLVDATNETLGRLSSKVAKILRGKHKPSFTPHVDCGDYVVVINAEKIKLTGDKFEKKEYISHTGYPGGQRIKTAKQIFQKNPTILIEKAIKGMLPKNKLGSIIFSNLKVYNDDVHNHTAQNPKLINLKEF